MTDLKTMTDAELAEHVESMWRTGMRYEAASRGYDFNAAAGVWNRHREATAEQAWRECRRRAEPLLQVLDALVGSPKP